MVQHISLPFCSQLRQACMPVSRSSLLLKRHVNGLLQALLCVDLHCCPVAHPCLLFKTRSFLSMRNIHKAKAPCHGHSQHIYITIVVATICMWQLSQNVSIALSCNATLEKVGQE